MQLVPCTSKSGVRAITCFSFVGKQTPSAVAPRQAACAVVHSLHVSALFMQLWSLKDGHDTRTRCIRHERAYPSLNMTPVSPRDCVVLPLMRHLTNRTRHQSPSQSPLASATCHCRPTSAMHHSPIMSCARGMLTRTLPRHRLRQHLFNPLTSLNLYHGEKATFLWGRIQSATTADDG